MRRLLTVTMVLLAIAGSGFCKDKTDPVVELKLKAEAAKPLMDYATWCSAHGAKTEGTAAMDEAEYLDAGVRDLAKTKTVLEGLTEDAAGAAAGVAEQRKKAGPSIAAAYDKLAALEHDPKDAVRFEGYLFRAMGWDPAKARIERARKLVDDAAAGNRGEEAGRVLARLEKVDAEGVAAGRYEKAELDLATKDVLLMGTAEHPLVGYVSLPRGWMRTKTYPVLVGVEGAGCNFLGYCRASMAARGSRQVIVVAPVTLSNANELKPETYPLYGKAILEKYAPQPQRVDFDGPGVDALLAAVRKRFGGEEQVFLTGFSGGGMFTYWRLFHDPAHVRGAAPACGNFAAFCGDGAAAPGAAGGPPVRLFTGEKDPNKDEVAGKKPGIAGQTDQAQEKLKSLGFQHVERVQVKGAGHDALHAQVWKFVEEVMAAK